MWGGMEDATDGLFMSPPGSCVVLPHRSVMLWSRAFGRRVGHEGRASGVGWCPPAGHPRGLPGPARVWTQPGDSVHALGLSLWGNHSRRDLDLGLQDHEK